MTEIVLIKDRLIDKLWIPIAIAGGKILYSRRKKNKRMKVLTLTHHSNCRETDEFIKNKLTNKELIVGWNKGTTEAIRLEGERLGSVVGPYVYEDSIIGGMPDVQNKFPFDILNLDFSSQNPESEGERGEREILSIEHTINLQADKRNDGMVLIYTTLLDSNPLNLNEIKQSSDNIGIQGWGGLSIDRLPYNTTDYREKIRCLKEILQQIFSKYQYENIEDFDPLCIGLSNGSGYVLSIGVLLIRS